MSRRLILLAGIFFFLAALPVQAGSELADHLYGRGAHAYYAGDFVKAHELMTAAIEGASNDPRVYYFRGLAYLKLGRPEQARIDFQTGSLIEMADTNAFYNVSKALERIQGNDRLEIEQYRSEARVAAMKRAKAIRHARYETIRSQESRVLRKGVSGASQPIESVKAKSAESTQATGGDFEDTTAPAKSSQGSDDPFGSSKSPSKKASEEADPFAGDDPFGSSTPAKKAEPAEETPAEKAPAKKKAPVKKKAPEPDPFGGDDPFSTSTEPKKEEPAEKAPAKKTPAASDDDPFATSPAPKKEEPAEKAPEKKVPAKKAPAKKTPAPAEDDPFAASPAPKKEAPAEKAIAENGPAKKMQEADPFGDKDPFSGAQQPAIGAEKKTAARPPVTKPATDPVAVRPVAAVQPLSKSAKATPEVPGPKDPVASKPEKENPFVEEPITAGNE